MVIYMKKCGKNCEIIKRIVNKKEMIYNFQLKWGEIEDLEEEEG